MVLNEFGEPLTKNTKDFETFHSDRQLRIMSRTRKYKSFYFNCRTNTADRIRFVIYGNLEVKILTP